MIAVTVVIVVVVVVAYEDIPANDKISNAAHFWRPVYNAFNSITSSNLIKFFLSLISQ